MFQARDGEGRAEGLLKCCTLLMERHLWLDSHSFRMSWRPLFTLPFPSSLLSSSLHIFFLYNLFYTGVDCFELETSENLESTEPNPYCSIRTVRDSAVDQTNQVTMMLPYAFHASPLCAWFVSTKQMPVLTAVWPLTWPCIYWVHHCSQISAQWFSST